MTNTKLKEFIRCFSNDSVTTCSQSINGWPWVQVLLFIMKEERRGSNAHIKSKKNSRFGKGFSIPLSTNCSFHSIKTILWLLLKVYRYPYVEDQQYSRAFFPQCRVNLVTGEDNASHRNTPLSYQHLTWLFIVFLHYWIIRRSLISC